jgi:hypothetical protein
MKAIRLSVICILIFLIYAAAAYAHRPVIVKNKSSKDNPVLVDEPEISWAYYGVLEGEPHYYKIDSSQPFNLYVNILVPDFHPDGEPVLRHDMSFKIFSEDTLFYEGEGLNNEWHRFYEEYGKDHYYWGPEFDQNVEAGTYSVVVYNSTNSGKYALAIGKREKFNFLSIMGAMVKAKHLDIWFFKGDAK